MVKRDNHVELTLDEYADFRILASWIRDLKEGKVSLPLCRVHQKQINAMKIQLMAFIGVMAFVAQLISPYILSLWKNNAAH